MSVYFLPTNLYICIFRETFQKLGANKNEKPKEEPVNATVNPEPPPKTEKPPKVTPPGGQTPDLIKETKDTETKLHSTKDAKGDTGKSDKEKSSNREEDKVNRDDKTNKGADWDMFAEQDNFDNYDVS